jgi:hypothetical protein
VNLGSTHSDEPVDVREQFAAKVPMPWPEKEAQSHVNLDAAHTKTDDDNVIFLRRGSLCNSLQRCPAHSLEVFLCADVLLATLLGVPVIPTPGCECASL